MDWEDYRAEFKFDGSFRDIYVLDTSVSDWQCLIDFFRTGQYRFSYTLDGEKAVLPEQVKEIFRIRNEEASANIQLYAGSVLIGCHFFDEREMEFDIDPRDVKSEANAEEIFAFMRQIGELLNKEVILTDECSSVEMALNEVIFRYSPSMKQIRYIGRDN